MWRPEREVLCLPTLGPGPIPGIPSWAEWNVSGGSGVGLLQEVTLSQSTGSCKEKHLPSVLQFGQDSLANRHGLRFHSSAEPVVIRVTDFRCCCCLIVPFVSSSSENSPRSSEAGLI